MTEIVVAQPETAQKSLAARLIGTVVSPADTFRSIVAHPRWFGALAVTTLIVIAVQFAFLSTTVGQNATFDQQVKSMENWGMTVTPEISSRIEAGLPNARFWTAGAILVISPILVGLFSGIVYVVFTALMGGGGTFRQAMAVVTHAGVISVLGQLFTVPLNYARESVSSATSLAVLLPFLDEGSVPARFFGIIDLFVIWWLAVLAIGCAVLYRRRAGRIFASFLGVYIVIAILIAIVMRAVAGSQ
jgi:Yip1 domain